MPHHTEAQKLTPRAKDAAGSANISAHIPSSRMYNIWLCCVTPSKDNGVRFMLNCICFSYCTLLCIPTPTFAYCHRRHLRDGCVHPSIVFTCIHVCVCATPLLSANLGVLILILVSDSNNKHSCKYAVKATWRCCGTKFNVPHLAILDIVVILNSSIYAKRVIILQDIQKQKKKRLFFH